MMHAEEVRDTLLPLFDLKGSIIDVAPYGEGHINSTFLVTASDGKYIVQRINDSVFHDVPALMRNIELVTEHLRRKSRDSRSVLDLVYAKNGSSYVMHNGSYFRIYGYVEDSMCLQMAESNEDFYQSAVAFGRFSEDLSDFNASSLTEVIPDFHNTPKRYLDFRKAIAEDKMGRVKEVQREIGFILAREEEMGTLQRMRESGNLPLRVTHNDTKLNNVLFDRKTRKALCVIDLDTVMPGLSLYDYGDSIRFGASTALEDEPDLDRVWLSMDLYRAYTDGYRSACTSLTDAEVDMLAMGAKTMTLECGMRFLADYIEGDVYYSIKREKHNLDRTRTQLKLVSDMERHWSDMERIAHNPEEAI